MVAQNEDWNNLIKMDGQRKISTLRKNAFNTTLFNFDTLITANV